jgi:23S rRNA U2552 (ribose-2'-O)-methylase RlmE/FtsJ
VGFDPSSTIKRILTLLSDQQAVETLISLAETYGGHANTIVADSKEAVKGARQGDSDLQIAEADLKVRFSVLGFIRDSRGKR